MPTEIEYLEAQIAEVEKNLRLIEERKDEYVEKTHIPLDLIRDERLQQERLGELRQRLEIARTAAAPVPAAAPRRVIVDRDEERRLFREMVFGRSPIHILLMEAPGGMGKTVLLEQFWELSDSLQRSRIDFKHASYTPLEVLRDLCDQHRPELFSIFQEVCCSALRDLGQDIRHMALLWTTLELKLKGLPPEDRDGYYKLITDAFLANLDAIRPPEQAIVLLIDTFEKASEPTREWIVRYWIPAIRRYPRLVCIISGREVPRIATQDSNWCLQHTLQPLSEAHRIEYIQKVRFTQNQELVTFIVKYSKGVPLELQQLVQTLVEEET